MPGVINRAAPAKRAAVLADDAAVLADDNAVGIGMDLDRPPDRAGSHRVLVVIEAHLAGL